jgi:hypothetical protein
MRFFPKNKFLVVEPSASKKPEQNSGFILPDDFNKEPFTLAKIVETQSQEYCTGQMVLFPTNMMEEVNISGHKLFFVPENAVYGVME